MNKLLVGLLAGFLFGAGLAISGMTDVQKVLGFLDVFGAWDISLMLVMAAGLMVSVPSYYFVKKQKTACFDNVLHLPNTTRIDKPLIIGAALFGVGWGLYGYCPGPAIVSVVYGEVNTGLFLIAMLVGMGLASKVKGGT